jgi:hypothetical protein
MGGLSVALAFAAGTLSQTRTPGWWVAGTIFKAARAQDLRYIPLFFAMTIAVDWSIFFALLCGGYLLWGRAKQKALMRATSQHRT